MTTEIFIGMLLVHWFADFIMQSHEMASNKSTSNKFLLAHTGIYSLWWWNVVLIYQIFTVDIVTLKTALIPFLFALITFVLHTATDYITSREVKKRFDVKNFHDGFVIIGFDQILHYVQLYFTAKLLGII